MNAEEASRRATGLVCRFEHDNLYDRLGVSEVDLLGNCLGVEFYRHAHAGHMELTLSERSDAAFVDGRLNAAALRVDGPYFRDREAVTIDSLGRVHLAGWADSTNIAPFLDGFERWMDTIEEGAECQTSPR